MLHNTPPRLRLYFDRLRRMATLYCISLAGVALECPAAPRPNVVVFFMDDMGYNDIGAYTYPSKANPGPPPPAIVAENGDSADPNFALSLTPRIDSLAKDGACLTHFYSTSSVCTPSRAALMTGSYPQRVGLSRVIGANVNNGLNSTEVTLPEVLREEGYLTTMVGKWHLGDKPDFNPVRHGFNRYRGILYSNDMWPQNPYNSNWPTLYLMDGESPMTGHTTASGYTISGAIDTDAEQSYLLEALTEAAVDGIDAAVAADRPFFLYFSPHTPHVPVHPHPDFLSTAGQADDEARYADVIREIDARVGTILDRLAFHGVENNTLVVFTSDNGPWQNRPGGGDLPQGAGSAYPFRGHKHTNWEGGHRVPFLVRYSGVIPAGQTLDQTATTFDLFATITGIAGAALPTDRILDSVDLGPLLRGENGEEPHDAFYYYKNGARSADGMIALEGSGKFKLGTNGALYEIGTGFTADFQENSDVSATYPQKKSDLQARLAAWNGAFSTRPTRNAQSIRIELETDEVVVGEGGSATVRIRLSGSADQTVNISRFSGDRDLVVASGASLGFDSGNWNQWQTVTFQALGDSDEIDGGATFRAEAPELHLREIFVRESESPGMTVPATSN